MARNSTYGDSHGSEISKYARAIIGNAGNISKEEVEILKFLAYKGSFESQRVVIIDKDSKLNNLIKEKK
jgi:hypothetical protein